eukprot:1819373-Heterocapsa_arctica.AAC.1
MVAAALTHRAVPKVWQAPDGRLHDFSASSEHGARAIMAREVAKASAAPTQRPLPVEPAAPSVLESAPAVWPCGNNYAYSDEPAMWQQAGSISGVATDSGTGARPQPAAPAENTDPSAPSQEEGEKGKPDK